MKNEDRFVDDLVRQYLHRQQEEVDAEGMVQQIMKRRRRILGFHGGHWRFIAVAAALLLLVGLLAVYVPRREDRKQPAPQPLALTPLEEAMRTEAYAVWGALTTVGGAALEAGREPVTELASAGPDIYSFPDDARRHLYELPGSARRWFDRSMSMVQVGTVPKKNQEEKK